MMNAHKTKNGLYGILSKGYKCSGSSTKTEIGTENVL